jgi:hypothetical protein
MEENRRPPDLEEIDNPDVGHEHKDINIGLLVKLALVFIVAGILIHFLLWAVFGYFRGREAAVAPPTSVGIGVDARQLPPEPRLQPAPIQDLSDMRAAEDEILEGYGWIDEGRGVARIPVSRAIELLAGEGLPSRPPAPPPPAEVTVPSDAGLGPIMTQAGGPLSPNRVFPPSQPLEIRGPGDFRFGRQAGGPPTPPEYSLGEVVDGVTPPRGAAQAPGGREPAGQAPAQ